MTQFKNLGRHKGQSQGSSCNSMASTNNVIFPKSMVDFLANPVDICFGSMR
jgi:hypothetical protein